MNCFNKMPKCKRLDILSYIAIFFLIASSGGNPKIRNIVFLVIVSVMIAIFNNRIRPRYVFIYALLIVYIYINSFVVNIAPPSIKEFIMLIIRLSCCLLIASNIDLEINKDIFLNIITFLACFSLIWFSFMLLDIPIPFAYAKDGNYCAFYHTLAIGNDEVIGRIRNSGIFWEPGVFQIYLNMGIVILCEDKNVPIRKAKMMFYILSLTLFTTLSSMGLMIYVVVLALCYIDRRELFPKYVKIRREERIYILAIVALGVVIEELSVGILMNVITNVNSWASRHDDTILTFLMALQHPLTGIGIATDHIPIWDYYYEKYAFLRSYTGYQNARSNGLGNYMAGGGLIFAAIYVWAVVKSFIRMTNVNKMFSKILITFIFILFFMEEPIMPTPFFLISFFWSNSKYIENGEKYEGTLESKISVQ